ncbi:MAG: hypothetical protein F6K10_41205, partial [Moorea sp. SIO2B7]|nr:hypothetical protein [Moorena sp. SIO2B7]
FPIPDSRFPIPVPLLGGVRGGFRFPIPDSRFPIPDSRFPIPYLPEIAIIINYDCSYSQLSSHD